MKAISMIFAFALSVCVVGIPLTYQMEVAKTPADRIAEIKDGDTITLPDGFVNIEKPIKLTAKRNARIVAGKNTLLNYTGPTTRGLIQFEHCDSCVIQGPLTLRIDKAAGEVESGIWIGNNAIADPSYQSTACRVEDVSLTWDGSAGIPKYGVNVDSTERDANNEHHHFKRVKILAASIAAFRVWGTQCHQILFDRCMALNYSTVKPNEGTMKHFVLYENGGNSFRATGCSVGGYPIQSDFRLLGPGSAAVIEHHNSELSYQFVDSPDLMYALAIRDSRWDGIVKDKATIDVFGVGPLTIENTALVSNNGNAPQIVMRGPARRPGMLNATGLLFSKFSNVDVITPSVVFPLGWQGQASGIVQTVTLQDSGREWMFRAARVERPR